MGPYEDASSFTDGIAAVKTGDIWKLIGTDGSYINDASFEDIHLFGNGIYIRDGIMIAAEDGRYNYYDASGNLLVRLDASNADLDMGELIAFSNAEGLWGFSDREGNIVLEPQYNEAMSFSKGLAAVFDGEKWGYIDMTEKLVIDYQFSEAGYFTADGMCIVSIIPETYTIIQLRFPDGL